MNNGNLWSQKVTPSTAVAITQYYAYDGLNRLTVATENPTTAPTSSSQVLCPDAGSSWCEKYNSDQFGNRLISARSNLTTSYLEPSSYNEATNRIANGTTTWSYDNSGNLTSYTNGALVGGYAFDAENRMTAYCPSATNCTSTWASGNTVYGYDGDGRRVSKKTGDGTVTTYVYDASGELVAEYGGSASTVTGAQYLTADHLGSTRLITGATLERLDYLPYGEAIPVSSGSPRNGVPGYTVDAGVKQLFTGKERDAETGLDYFLTRYFSSAQGRFTSTDPLPWLHWQQAGDEDRANFQQFISDPQNFNLYAYARNNPLRFSDPTGMYYCAGTTAQCADLRKAYEQAQAAAKSKDLTDKQKAAIQQVLKFLGKPREVNGVVVKFAGTGAGTTGNTDVAKPFGSLITTITLNPTKFGALDTESQAETFIHEGRHGVDDAARGRGPETRVEELTTERNAYRVQSFVGQGSGVASRWGLWDPTWSSPQAEINRQKAIETNAQKSTKAACAGGGCR